MEAPVVPEFTLLQAMAAIGIAIGYLTLSLLVEEPHRHTVLALWFFCGAPSVFDGFRSVRTSKINVS